MKKAAAAADPVGGAPGVIERVRPEGSALARRPVVFVWDEAWPLGRHPGRPVPDMVRLQRQGRGRMTRCAAW